jgi:hypothetical protein
VTADTTSTACFSLAGLRLSLEAQLRLPEEVSWSQFCETVLAEIY